MKPSLTPIKALKALQKVPQFIHDGWVYVMDGPMGCPDESMAPVATLESDVFFCTGEPGDIVDDKTEWVE